MKPKECKIMKCDECERKAIISYYNGNDLELTGAKCETHFKGCKICFSSFCKGCNKSQQQIGVVNHGSPS